MARTTTLTGVIVTSTKKITLTGQIAIREKVNLSLTGYGVAGAADLVLAIVHNGALMAKLTPLVDYTTYFGGVLDLNTTEIVAVFDGMAANARVKMSLVLWDTTNECTIVNDWIMVANNPYDPDMEDTTPVDPIGNVEYAPMANGVTNGDSHDHNGGDGADLSTRYLLRVPPGANFRVATDGYTLELKDVVSGEWKTLILANGTLGVGAAL
jgi:hypothetical protein